MTSMTRAQLSLVAALAIGFASPVAQASAETIIRYVPSAEPRTMDPIVSTLAITQQHGYLVYDTLFSLDSNLKPQPQMIKGFTRSEDGLTFTMTLRDDLQFHDGSPVTSGDVIASIDRWAKKDGLGIRLKAMGLKLAEVDAKTFTVTTDVATDLVIDGFAKSSSSAPFIMRKQDAAAPISEPVKNIIGSGPFRFVKEEYVPGAKMVYAKFKNYVPRAEPANYLAGGKVAKIDRVEWDIMPDATSAVSALQAGEVDIYEAPPQDLLPVLKAQANIIVRPLNKLGQFGFLRPNFLQPPFNNVKAREALQLLIDQSEVMSVAVGSDQENWSACYSFFSCGGSNETSSGTEGLHKRNVEKAKQLLKESGYKGERVVLLAPGDNAVLNAFVQVVAPRLKEGGLNIDTEYSDFSTLLARRANKGTPDQGGWNLFPMWTFTFESDNPLLGAYFNSVCSEQAYPGWYCSNQIEQLKKDWVLAKTDAEKKAGIDGIQKIMARELPIIPLGKFTSPIAYSSKIKGFLDTPVPVFWNLSVEK